MWITSSLFETKAIKFACRREKLIHLLVNSLSSLQQWLLASLNRQCRVQHREIYPFICCGHGPMHPTTHHFYFILLVFYLAGWLSRIMSPNVIINQNYGLKNWGEGNCLQGCQAWTWPQKEEREREREGRKQTQCVREWEDAEQWQLKCDSLWTYSTAQCEIFVINKIWKR